MGSVVAAQVRRPPAWVRLAPRPGASRADVRDGGAGLLGLQQLAGNRAVALLVQRKSRVQERFDNLEDGHGLSSPIMSGDQELEECFDGRRVLKPGASGVPVSKLRQALAQVGFASTDAADEYGPNTTKAVQSFQKKVGLPTGQQDGLVGRITIGHLDRAGSAGAVQADEDKAATDFQIVETPAEGEKNRDEVYFTSDKAEPDSKELEKIKEMAAKALKPSAGPGALPIPGPQPLFLLGGASWEGSAAHNKELAQRRMARVSALLAAHGHPQSLHTLENRAAEGQGQVDYAKQRRVRMVPGKLAATDKACVDGACTQEKKDAHLAARDTAEKHVAQARNRLAAGSHDSHKHVDRLYRTDQTTRPRTIASIDTQMGLVLDQLGRLRNEATGDARSAPGFRCDCKCKAVAFNRDCADAAGTENLPGEMILCPRFFEMPKEWQPLLLIHESHHGIKGEHSSDIAYNYTRLLLLLDTADALENANSFHALVRMINSDIYDKVAAKDTFGIGDVGRKESDKLESGLDANPALAKGTDQAIAVLEQWLLLSDFDTQQAYDAIDKSRSKQKPLNESKIDVLSFYFPISKNGQIATERDQRRTAAIYDRMIRFQKAFNSTLTIGVGALEWERGPGKRVTVPTTFAAMSEKQRITALLQAVVHATHDVSAELEPAYVNAVADFANRRGLVGT